MPFQHGIALGLYHADPNHSYVREIQEIRATGADTVSFIVVWMQEDIHAMQIREVPGRTVPEDKLIEAIRAAHDEGLRVMVFPIVLLENAGMGEWRGRLDPPAVELWFANYSERLLHLAALCEREGVELLSIGSEFSSLEQHTDHWRELITSTREVFSGWLTYSGNWDHLRVLRVWDQLDFMSVSAYFELAEERDVPESWLDGAWQHHRDQLLAIHAEVAPDLPLVISEVGYASQDGIAEHPWNYTLDHPLDLEEQRQCYAAFIRTWEGVPQLRGVYFYEWGGDGGGPADTSYTPRGKPAEELIRRWYSQGETPELDEEEAELP